MEKHNMRNNVSVWLTAVILTISGTARSQVIPNAPDYNDATMWITADGDSLGTGADVFYVVSTWEEDWKTEDGQVSHYADVWNPAHRGHMATEINRVAAYMSPGNRFFAPYYRHTTIEAFMLNNPDSTRQRAQLAMADVCAAFDYFQAHRDTSRPLVIAGFSQGGMAVVELLKHISNETYSQLAAAYVLGYKVTPADTTVCRRIKAAQGDSDTGVTICYNTVKDVKYVNPVIAPIVCGLLCQRFLPSLTRHVTPYLPAFSSVVIAMVVGIVVSHNAGRLLTAGLIVVAVVMIHNLLGLAIGFTVGRLLKLQNPKCVALSIEVGMQNSGLASSLAVLHFAAYPLATIPGAVFSVWHNISGALAARCYSQMIRNKQSIIKEN